MNPPEGPVCVLLADNARVVVHELVQLVIELGGFLQAVSRVEINIWGFLVCRRSCLYVYFVNPYVCIFNVPYHYYVDLYFKNTTGLSYSNQFAKLYGQFVVV